MFQYADLYAHLKALSKIELKGTCETTTEQRDFLSWVQTMNPEACYNCFFYHTNCKESGEITPESVQKALKFLIPSLLKTVSVKNQDDLVRELLQ